MQQQQTLQVPQRGARQRRSSYQQNMFSIASPDRSDIIEKYNKRQLTDKCCIVAYSLLSFVVISAFFYSYILEKEKNIFKPKDPDGRKCGYGQALSYPYIYFPVPFAGTLHKTTCVKSCPKSPDDRVDCLKNSAVTKCEFNMHDIFNRSTQFLVYPTRTNDFLSMCQPDSRILFDAVNSQINTYSLMMNLEQIYQSLYVILIACPLITILLVAMYVTIITQIQDLKPVFKFFIVFFIIVLASFSIYSFTSGAKQIFHYMPYLGIAAFVFIVAFVTILIFYNKYIDGSLDLINYGAEYVRQNRGLIFMSIALFLVWILVFALEIVALVFIYSIDSSNTTVGDYSFPYFTAIQNSLLVKILIIMTIVHYFWTNLIIYAMGEYICMAASAFWILQVQHNFKNSLFSLLRFHFGTVIYGSIVNPFLGRVTDLLYFFMPNHGGRCFTCCPLKCICHNCYKSDIYKKYIGIYSDLSYIQVAIQGKGYTEAGQDVAVILVENINHVHRAYRIARLIVFISKILVAFITTLICYAIIELSPNIRGYFLTNIIIFIFSSFLSSFAFDSYDRSFQVILITTLLADDKKLIQNVLVSHIPVLDTGKRKIFRQISAWFNQEKAKEAGEKQNQQKEINNK